MSDYRIIEPQLGRIPVSSTGTSQLLPLGYRAQAQDLQTGSTNCGCGIFQYVVGAAASGPIKGDLALLIGDTVQKAGSASIASLFPVGIAAGSISSTNVYGWVQVRGLCDYANMENASTDSYNAGGRAATAFIGSATDGCMNTTQTATGNAIIGIGFPGGSLAISGTRSGWSAASFNAMTVQLFDPFVQGSPRSIL